MQTRYTAQLGQEVKTQGRRLESWAMTFCLTKERLFGFYLYKGNDLTTTNTEGNTPCIFSKILIMSTSREYTASIRELRQLYLCAGSS